MPMSALNTLLPKTRLIGHHDPARVTEIVQRISADVVACSLSVPAVEVQQPLHAVRGQVASLLGQRPRVLPLRPRQQPSTYIRARRRESACAKHPATSANASSNPACHRARRSPATVHDAATAPSSRSNGHCKSASARMYRVTGRSLSRQRTQIVTQGGAHTPLRARVSGGTTSGTVDSASRATGRPTVHSGSKRFPYGPATVSAMKAAFGTCRASRERRLHDKRARRTRPCRRMP